MEQAFDYLEQIIRSRRTVKPARMNGRTISSDLILRLISLADWAPTHGKTEPWRFLIFEGERLRSFSFVHAELYRQYVSPEDFKQAKYDKIAHYGDNASHLIIVVMKRTVASKIKEREEYAAVAASVQNMLLGATALGLASMWSTHGMSGSNEMKSLLGLAEEDCVVSFLYLGYTDESPREETRKISLSEKMKWNY